MDSHGIRADLILEFRLSLSTQFKACCMQNNHNADSARTRTSPNIAKQEKTTVSSGQHEGYRDDLLAMIERLGAKVRQQGDAVRDLNARVDSNVNVVPESHKPGPRIQQTPRLRLVKG